MKMIIVIINDQDADQVTHQLTTARYRVTRIASTGGWLRRGVVTLLIGTEENRVDTAIEIIKKFTTTPDSPEKNRATLFVVPVDDFKQI